jgi:hypothetical protein
MNWISLGFLVKLLTIKGSRARNEPSNPN